MVNLKVNAIEKRLSDIYEKIKKGSSMTKVETMMKNLKEAWQCFVQWIVVKGETLEIFALLEKLQHKVEMCEGDVSEFF